MSNIYLWERLAGPNPNLRAADADRERIAERLRTGHAEGRLDTDEFQERLGRCYASKTVGELSELVKDLPRPLEPHERRSLGWAALWRPRLAALAAILLALVVLSAGHAHNIFWVWIPLVFLLWRVSWFRRRRSWTGGRRWDGWS